MNQHGFRVRLMRTPRWMEEQGCGYALKLWMQDVALAVELLRETRIQLRKVYVQMEDGGMKEVTM